VTVPGRVELASWEKKTSAHATSKTPSLTLMIFSLFWWTRMERAVYFRFQWSCWTTPIFKRCQDPRTIHLGANPQQVVYLFAMTHSDLFIVSVFIGLTILLGAWPIPLSEAHTALNETSTSIAHHAALEPPHFVIYSDKFVPGLIGPPPISRIKVGSHQMSFTPHLILLFKKCKGYNVLWAFIIAFSILYLVAFSVCKSSLQDWKYT